MNVKNYNQDQNLLFPPHLKDFLPDDHQAMIINDIVETLDLSCLYRKVSSEGNPAYHPKMMLKILIYAYANGIFSSRKIQAAVQESVAFIFLLCWLRMCWWLKMVMLSCTLKLQCLRVTFSETKHIFT